MRLLAIVSLAAATLACPGAGVRPTKDRPPMQTDFDRCYRMAKQLGAAGLQGSLTLKMHVQADGAVSSAFVNDQKGLDVLSFHKCIVDFIVASKFPPEGSDYLRPYGRISFSEVTAKMPDQRDVPNEPMDEKLASETLEFADWADAADRGWGSFFVRKYPDAIARFREALQKNPEDVRALRGLASGLAASGGDLKEAREAAAKAVQQKPDSAATHEAMLRVCIAAKDDACAYQSWEKAIKAPDRNTRSYELSALQDAAKAAADRLQGQEKQRHEQDVAKRKAEIEAQRKKIDPLGCSSLGQGDERTLCFVKTCFDKGAHTYAGSLKSLTGQDYGAGDWSIGPAGSKSKVTVSIRATAAGQQPHDAAWEVEVGEELKMKPLDIDANNITQQHNACARK